MKKELIQTDVLIIGSGIAGASTAIKLAIKDPKLQITILSKSTNINESNTNYAQGGIIAKGGTDLVKDILNSGDALSLPESAKILSEEGPELVSSFLADFCKTPFDKEKNGELSFALEGGHSEPRVAKVADFTGKSIQEHLSASLKKFKNINIFTDLTAIDLLTNTHHSKDKLQKYKEEVCLGAYVYDHNDGQVSRIISEKTVLATGGYSQIFAFSTNPSGAIGDGLAMASRAGVKFLGLEFEQFHPTALKLPNTPPFLISEAVRGEGARLTNISGEPFMQKYFPELTKPDLTTRDKVARSIFTEMLKTGEGNVYLDLFSYMTKSHILHHFPVIHKTCLSYGIDITKDLIPVSPAAHYSCGGILTDLKGQTSLKNLYAVGEVANNGLHGANRLASTSLLEGLVFGTRAAANISKDLSCHSREGGNPLNNSAEILPWVDTSEYNADPALIASDKITIKNIMWNMVGLVRNRKNLERAVTDLTRLEESVNTFYKKAKINTDLLGLRNMSQTALLVAKSALLNATSSGCHFREN